MILSGLLLLLLAGEPLATEQMRVVPTSEGDAVSEFEATCLAGFRDMAVLKQAVSASKRGYVEQAAGKSRAADWVSQFGEVHYFEGKTRRQAGCDVISYTPDTVRQDVLALRIDALASRHAAEKYTEIADGDQTTWTWRDAQNRPVSVTMVLRRNAPQQIILSLRSII